MLFKHRDSKTVELKELQQLLSTNLTEKQKFAIEREFNTIGKGEEGESDSAYYINFYYGNSKNWAVIHDLRIEFEGLVAQIDHILINKLFDFYILESKNYKNGIKITDNGEFEAFYNKKSFGIPSPLEQNERHIFALDKFLHVHKLLPKRMGVTIKPTYFNYILISPKSTIKRPAANKFDSTNVIKADTLKTVIDKNTERISALSGIAKASSFSTIEDLAKKLVSLHKPIKMNWAKRFGIDKQAGSERENSTTPGDKKNTNYFCAKCKKNISEKVAKFCWHNKERFNGRAYCFDCQKLIK